MQEITNPKIVVFDLDLTISTRHTGGIYKKVKKEWDIKNYITSTKIDALIECIEKLKACNIKIYLCSRGELNACYWFLYDSNLLRYFDGVFGAKNLKKYPELHFLTDRYSIESQEATKAIGETNWKDEKVRIIRKISELERESNIYFYDDTEENIVAAREDGIRSFLVNPENEMSLIDLMIENILCLKSSSDEFIDLTEEFQGSVRNAINYFTQNPEDRRKVKVYSKSKRRWFANNKPETPNEFYLYNQPIIDLTEHFKGSVTNAIKYFSDHPEDKRTVKIYSQRVGKWFANTKPETPSEFFVYNEPTTTIQPRVEPTTIQPRVDPTVASEPTIEPIVSHTVDLIDLTEQFQGSVRNAMKYFSDHPEDKRIVKIYSKSKRRWFANTKPETPDKFYPLDEFSKKYNYKHLYLKYKGKYLKLKNKL